MRIRCALATAAIVVPVIAMAQEAARDITREMGADTTTSVSQGLDRTGLHRDTSTVRQAQQHAPTLLDSSQGEAPKPKKLTKSEKKKLLRQKEVLLENRKAAIEAAAKKAAGAANKADRVYVTSQQLTGDEAAARKKAERDWDSRWGNDLQAIERALNERSEGGTAVRFHAPSLVNPK